MTVATLRLRTEHGVTQSRIIASLFVLWCVSRAFDFDIMPFAVERLEGKAFEDAFSLIRRMGVNSFEDAPPLINMLDDENQKVVVENEAVTTRMRKKAAEIYRAFAQAFFCDSLRVFRPCNRFMISFICIRFCSLLGGMEVKRRLLEHDVRLLGAQALCERGRQRISVDLRLSHKEKHVLVELKWSRKGLRTAMCNARDSRDKLRGAAFGRNPHAHWQFGNKDRVIAQRIGFLGVDRTTWMLEVEDRGGHLVGQFPPRQYDSGSSKRNRAFAEGNREPRRKEAEARKTIRKKASYSERNSRYCRTWRSKQ